MRGFAPEPLPDPRIPGFTFPESEATLTRWIMDLSRGDPLESAPAAFEKIHRHGWGLWTAVTMETTRSYNGQRLRVFETWATPEDLLQDVPTRRPWTAAVRSRLRQLDPSLPRRNKMRRIAPAESIDRVLGFVKFDPTAAAHIRAQQLLRTDALDNLLIGGAQQIPPFPATALALKPVFQVIRMRDLVEGRYSPLKAWPGPPTAPRPWAPAHWPDSVWIDVLGEGQGQGAVDSVSLADGSTRTDDTTYPIHSFIHYRLSAADAVALNEERPATRASAGDIALLVAMHISGREIARWTWQTFWWTPSPEQPHAPSSAVIATLRPAALRGAARHYAMALGYSMLTPAEPYVGGANVSPAQYVYNPWLEAKLGPSDLPDSRPGFAPDGQPAANNHGVQTNCMSCHVQANYNPNERETAPGFTGARYIDLGAAEFVGTLQMDFLWSLARRAE